MASQPRVGHLMERSWCHHLARWLVRPLVGTPITANHITALRAITGALACLAFAWGSSRAIAWSGVMWMLSALLDRADGELARLAQQTSPSGHFYVLPETGDFAGCRTLSHASSSGATLRRAIMTSDGKSISIHGKPLISSYPNPRPARASSRSRIGSSYSSSSRRLAI